MELLNDRTYWRCQSDTRLLEEARDSNHELCIALGERLADLANSQELIADLTDEINELSRRCDALGAELDEQLNKED